MLRLAGCELSDVKEQVERDGLETTLRRLYEAGVYLTHDEFKGQQPIIRSGNQIPYDVKSCANPLATGGIDSRSSGSRGRAMRKTCQALLKQELVDVIASDGHRARSRTPYLKGAFELLRNQHRREQLSAWMAENPSSILAHGEV